MALARTMGLMAVAMTGLLSGASVVHSIFKPNLALPTLEPE